MKRGIAGVDVVSDELEPSAALSTIDVGYETYVINPLEPDVSTAVVGGGAVSVSLDVSGATTVGSDGVAIDPALSEEHDVVGLVSRVWGAVTPSDEGGVDDSSHEYVGVVAGGGELLFSEVDGFASRVWGVGVVSVAGPEDGGGLGAGG